MANMREIKMRIKSIKETRQITNAMKLISAAKLKKARQQLEQTLPFFEKVKETIADILIHSGHVESIYFDPRNQKPGRKKGYFVLTGDKGLAGGYNHNILKLTEEQIQKSPDSALFVAGQMGKSYLTRKGYPVWEDFFYPVQNPTSHRSREIAEYLLELFLSGKLDEIYIIYTEMASSIKLEPKVMKLLPLDLDAVREDIGYEKLKSTRIDEDLIYEPSPTAVFNAIIPKYVKGIVYGTLVEAFTSEQSARMTAMDSATANAEEMLHKLNLFYNRARQAAITQEISEIVGGAEVLK